MPLSAADIEPLIRTVQTSDNSHDVNDAVAVLIQNYSRYVSVPHARRGRLDPDELEALAAEGIWKAAKRFDLYQDAAKFGTFAHLITSRTVIDFLRRQAVQEGRTGRFTLDESQDAPTEADTTLDTLSAEEQAVEIRRLLSPHEQQVFDHRRRGFDFIEIAAALKCTAKSIGNASQRIREKVRQHFGGPQTY